MQFFVSGTTMVSSIHQLIRHRLFQAAFNIMVCALIYIIIFIVVQYISVLVGYLAASTDKVDAGLQSIISQHRHYNNHTYQVSYCPSLAANANVVVLSVTVGIPPLESFNRVDDSALVGQTIGLPPVGRHCGRVVPVVVQHLNTTCCIVHTSILTRPN